MELWIRSQDRKVFKEQKFLKIEEVENRTYKYGDIGKSNEYAIKDDNVLLGIYATEKRALEVLDEIQNLIWLGTDHMSFKEIKEKVKGMFYINNIDNRVIYEMPKE